VQHSLVVVVAVLARVRSAWDEHACSATIVACTKLHDVATRRCVLLGFFHNSALDALFLQEALAREAFHALVCVKHRAFHTEIGRAHV
jgi:hypothetical protein